VLLVTARNAKFAETCSSCPYASKTEYYGPLMSRRARDGVSSTRRAGCSHNLMQPENLRALFDAAVKCSDSMPRSEKRFNHSTAAYAPAAKTCGYRRPRCCQSHYVAGPLCSGCRGQIRGPRKETRMCRHHTTTASRVHIVTMHATRCGRAMSWSERPSARLQAVSRQGIMIRLSWT